MCNRYANRVGYRDYFEVFHELKISLVQPGPEAAPNLEPLHNIAPTDKAPIIRPVSGGVELLALRWGLIPWFHKGGVKDWKLLNTNARYETLSQTRSYKSAYAQRRCLVPASNFFEWTGPKGSKTKWSFARADGNWFCFAGLWDRAQTTDGDMETYTLVTTAAGADMRPYHERQPVILERADYADWLVHGAVPKTAIHAPGGILTATQAAR